MIIGAGLHGIISWRLASSIEHKRKVDIPEGLAGFACMREFQHQIRSLIGAEINHLRFDYESEEVDVLKIFRPSVVTAFRRNLSLWPVAKYASCHGKCYFPLRLPRSLDILSLASTKASLE